MIVVNGKGFTSVQAGGGFLGSAKMLIDASTVRARVAAGRVRKIDVTSVGHPQISIASNC
jgi:hypothetical protein